MAAATVTTMTARGDGDSDSDWRRQRSSNGRRTWGGQDVSENDQLLCKAGARTKQHASCDHMQMTPNYFLKKTVVALFVKTQYILAHQYLSSARS